MSDRDEEFWRQVLKRGADACWMWNGPVRRGSGLYPRAGGAVPAHEYAAEQVGMSGPVAQACGNPLCCNPAHLAPAGAVKTRAAKKAAAPVRSVPKATPKAPRDGDRLDEEKVREIVRRLAMGEAGRVLADEFGVTPAVITRIKQGKIWREVPRDLECCPSCGRPF